MEPRARCAGNERISELLLTEPHKGKRLITVVEPEHSFSDFWLPVGIQGSFAVGWRDCFYHQAHHILTAVALDEPIGPIGATFEDGYRVAEIVDTILRSGLSDSVEAMTFRYVQTRGWCRHSKNAGQRWRQGGDDPGFAA
jgi:hypothetical protein